jgi:hypothetical protein
MANVTSRSYSGPERRENRVFVTRNHEYHCRKGICVAVRDTRTGEFLSDHIAIGKKLSAAVVLSKNGIESIAMPDDAQRGQRLHFASHLEDRHDLLTSPLESIERPPVEIARRYS